MINQLKLLINQNVNVTLETLGGDNVTIKSRLLEITSDNELVFKLTTSKNGFCRLTCAADLVIEIVHRKFGDSDIKIEELLTP